ncbi:DNA-binding transcriptional regulator AsnC [Bordetella parapertussis]|nr:AsnC family transcriptional regulator [Bordetella parapertussis]AOB39681.1 hypothetical protein BBB43_13190 [Bordetella parapertussis]MEB2659346.1 AsnC family transcriptional regulator [Bordetella parapertussis]MEB2662847.1 AsnC family transcriptional regulator [Bordetella parapertussis]MEB2668092.1 AsnC family transcriptional regulator [Bordetella parapertussis]QBS57718.1 hypothetical protein B2B88_13290 [Bordetella parapertussis]
MDPRLDAIDRQLLSLLQANAREPAAILARKLHLARSTVVARIARLERDGVIAGYGVRCETHEQLDDLLDHIGLIDGVKQTQTSIVLSRRLDRRSAIAPG